MPKCSASCGAGVTGRSCGGTIDSTTMVRSRNQEATRKSLFIAEPRTSDNTPKQPAIDNTPKQPAIAGSRSLSERKGTIPDLPRSGDINERPGCNPAVIGPTGYQRATRPDARSACVADQQQSLSRSNLSASSSMSKEAVSQCEGCTRRHL